MPRYIAEIEHRIAGIPCIIGVTAFESQRGSYSSQADTPDEYYGYTDASWDVLDRKGYPAAWLERKVNQEIEEEIIAAIAEELG